MKRTNMLRPALILTAAAVVLVSLGGCTTSQSGGGSPAVSSASVPSSASPSASSTQVALPANSAKCTEASIKGALPKGSVLAKFECTIASPAMWAAARTKAGTVFFLTSVSGPWKVLPGKALCTAKIKEIPKELRGYCP